MKYAICFDFPESEGQPWFASLVGGAFGLTTDLAAAQKYDLESDAERVIQNAYGAGTSPFASVVEVPV